MSFKAFLAIFPFLMNAWTGVMSKRLTVWPPVRATTLASLTVSQMRPLVLTFAHATVDVPQDVKDRLFQG